MKSLSPIVKWAGGKRQLLPAIHERMPKEYDNYFEPFIGGGALLLDLQPGNATINDINESLINCYLQVRDNPNEVMSLADGYDVAIQSAEEPKEYYYQVRNSFNEHLSNSEYDLEAAALFIFINKHCFNGLYRVNAKGLYNVPFNGSTTSSYSKDNLLAVSEYLQGVNIMLGDFEEACKNAKEGDFVFFDSPYVPLKETTFEAYTKEGFAKEEHIRLANLFKHLDNIGCYCMLTNHFTPFIEELYDGYSMDIVSVKRFINADASNRKGVEVIIRNYGNE